MPDLTDAQLDELITQLGLDKPRPRKGPGARAACGTPSGYERHRNDGENACDPCKAANTAYKAEQQKRPVQDRTRLKPIDHGTPGGYKQHRYRGEEACADCKRALADYQRKQPQRSPEARRAQDRERYLAKKQAPVYLTEEEWQARRAARSGSAK